jgi:hypothetical protein
MTNSLRCALFASSCTLALMVGVLGGIYAGRMDPPPGGFVTVTYHHHGRAKTKIMVQQEAAKTVTQTVTQTVTAIPVDQTPILFRKREKPRPHHEGGGVKGD